MWMKGKGYTERAKFPSAALRFTHKKRYLLRDIYWPGSSIKYKNTAYELSPEKKGIILIASGGFIQHVWITSQLPVVTKIIIVEINNY